MLVRVSLALMVVTRHKGATLLLETGRRDRYTDDGRSCQFIQLPYTRHNNLRKSHKQITKQAKLITHEYQHYKQQQRSFCHQPTTVTLVTHNSEFISSYTTNSTYLLIVTDLQCFSSVILSHCWLDGRNSVLPM